MSKVQSMECLAAVRLGWVGLLAGVLALGACSSPVTEALETLAPEPDSAASAPAPASDAGLLLTGTIEANANHTVRVFPLVGGAVAHMGVELGDEVRRGQVLAVLRSGEIADLQNQRLASASDLAVARKNLAVAEELHQAELVPEQDVYRARKAVEQAAGTSAKIGRQLGVYGVSASGAYTLRAPIAGFVTEKNLTAGMRFTTSHIQSAFTVANLDSIWVLANVFEADLSRVRLGQEVEITTLSYPNAPLRSRINRVFNVLDHDSKVLKVRCTLANPGHRLKPGMHAMVRLPAAGAAPRPPQSQSRHATTATSGF